MPMSIVFTPSLGDNLQLTVPSIQDTITLRFTAQLSAQLHAQLKHDRGRVQLWSDLPSLAHTSGGNWCEFDFEETIVDDSPNRNAVKMSLTASPNSLHTTTEHFLTLQVAIPTAIRSQQVQYSFTYRLVYPSGEVKWLGLFGQNGTLVLTRAHDLDPSTNTLFFCWMDGSQRSEIRANIMHQGANPRQWRLRGLPQWTIASGPLGARGFFPSQKMPRCYFSCRVNGMIIPWLSPQFIL